MRKQLKTHNYLIFLVFAIFIADIILDLNGIKVAKYTIPICGILIIIGVFNAFKWIFPANYLVYRIWKKTGVLSWDALREYLHTDKSMKEIEEEYIAKHQV